jgi:hypothetical protein
MPAEISFRSKRKLLILYVCVLQFLPHPKKLRVTPAMEAGVEDRP